MMEEQKKKYTTVSVMRALHRDIGYLMVGVMIIYALSGLQMIHRGTNFLKYSTRSEKVLSPGLAMEELASELMMRDTRGATTIGDIISFPSGTTYNIVTGETVIITANLYWPFDKFSNLHKSGGSKIGKVFTTTIAILLAFLAISSFWMFSRSNKNFKRGIVLAIIGFAIAFFLLVTGQALQQPMSGGTTSGGPAPGGRESSTPVMEERSAVPDLPRGDSSARPEGERRALPEGEGQARPEGERMGRP